MSFNQVSGLSIKAGGREFIESNTTLEVARWEAALEELRSQVMIVPYGVGAWKVNARGHEAADGA